MGAILSESVSSKVEKSNEASVRSVSVVIPAHDSCETLGAQLEALASQDYSGEIEVVVVDNLSSDSLQATVDQFSDQLRSLTLVTADARPHPGYARNVGLEKAKHDLVLFCDADDVVASGWVAALVEAMVEAPLASGRLELTLLNPPDIAGSRGAQTDSLQNKFSFLLHGTAGNSAVWRHVHEAFGGFDESMPALEDTDYFWKAQLAGFVPVYAPDAVVHYRLRTGFGQIYRQARQYAMADVLLHQRYRSDGLAPISLWSGVKGWVRLVLRLPLLLSSSGRAKFAWLVGYRVGRVRGALSYRVPAL